MTPRPINYVPGAILRHMSGQSVYASIPTSAGEVQALCTIIDATKSNVSLRVLETFNAGRNRQIQPGHEQKCNPTSLYLVYANDPVIGARRVWFSTLDRPIAPIPETERLTMALF